MRQDDDARDAAHHDEDGEHRVIVRAAELQLERPRHGQEEIEVDGGAGDREEDLFARPSRRAHPGSSRPR